MAYFRFPSSIVLVLDLVLVLDFCREVASIWRPKPKKIEDEDENEDDFRRLPGGRVELPTKGL